MMKLELIVVGIVVCLLAKADFAPAPCVNRPVMKNQLVANDTLHRGDYMFSNDCRFKLFLQCDGNLVLYTTLGPLWASNTMNSGAITLLVQADGNLVLYTANSVPVWATMTNLRTNCGASTSLLLQNDGNLVIYSKCNGALWATNTYTNVRARTGKAFAECTAIRKKDEKIGAQLCADINEGFARPRPVPDVLCSPYFYECSKGKVFRINCLLGQRYDPERDDCFPIVFVPSCHGVHL